MNPNIQYFSLLEYVNKIELEEFVLDHIEETTEEFNKYLEKLWMYGKYSALMMWIDSIYREARASEKIETGKDKISIMDRDFKFDSLELNEKKLNQLHEMILSDNPDHIPTGKYREKDVKVVGIKNGELDVAYIAPSPDIVKPMMKEFIEIYKNPINEQLDNMFIKASLIHLLFVKIHPYMDGNGRTARKIHNMRFTKSFNKHCDMKLYISPINISENIYVNKITYAKRLRDIEFDNIKDDNHAINKWFDFILNMIDEQLYFIQTRIAQYDKTLEELDMRLTEEEKQLLDELMKKNKVTRKAKNKPKKR